MADKIKRFLENYWSLIILILFFSCLFGSLLSSHILLEKNGILYSSGSTWGDLPFHLSLINSFKERGFLTTLKNFPLYYQEQTRYPFVFDYLSTLLLGLGLNLRWAIIFPTFITLIVLIILIYFLTYKITKSKLAAFFSPILFVFNGSTFALYYFWKDFSQSSLPFFKFLKNLPVQYTHLSQHHIEFSNLIADFLLPQRTIVLGLAATCLAVIFLWNYWEKKKSSDLLKAGFVIGLMPLIHAHLFLALIIFCFFLFLTQLVYERELKIKDWLKWGIVVFILAIIPIWWLFPLGRKNFFRLQPGWMTDGEYFWWFWFKNLGFYFVLLVFSLSLIKKFKNWQKIITFYLPAILIWILGNLFIFQPWEFDNMKIFIFWFLLSIILISLLFDYIAKHQTAFIKWLFFGIFLIMIAPGFLAIYRELTVKFALYQPADLQLAQFIKKETSQQALFLTIDKHNNPISSLTGRQIIMGYMGWLWSHGIDYKTRYQELAEIYKGADRAYQFFSKYAPDYILVEKQLSPQWLINYDYFKQYFQPVFENSLYIVYKVEN